MANDDAWSSGWQQGAGAAQKKKDKKDNAKNNKIAPTGDLSDLPILHSGGKVKKTGAYRLRKGEAVLTVAQQRKAGIKKVGRKKSGVHKRVASKG